MKNEFISQVRVMRFLRNPTFFVTFTITSVAQETLLAGRAELVESSSVVTGDDVSVALLSIAIPRLLAAWGPMFFSMKSPTPACTTGDIRVLL